MLQTDAIEKYCLFLEALGRSQRTIDTNRERLEGLQDFLCNQEVYEIEEITPDLIDLYISSNYRKALSPFTVAGRIQVIKGFFSWCVKRHYLEQSPAAHLKKPRLDYQTKDKAIPQEDLDAMIRFARETGQIMTEALLMFLADTGCRVGELCSVDLDDVDFVRKEVLVNGKTGERLLDFTEKTAEALKIYLAYRNQDYPFGKALFLNSVGKRVTPNQVYMRFRKIADELGIKRYNPQAIRHRVGQGWLDQGANLELVRQKLGHKDIQTTALYYSHQDRGRAKIATKRFSIVKNT